MTFLSVLLPALTRALSLISVSGYFRNGRDSLRFQRGGRKPEILNAIATCNQIRYMTFSSPNSKGSRLLTCGHKQKSPHIQNTQKNAAVVPQTDTCAHSDTQPHALSARESEAFFPQIILHCFLRSPNWPGPARRPESETIKNSICIPVSEYSRSLLHTHQWLPSSVCDFKLQAVFHIYFNAASA